MTRTGPKKSLLLCTSSLIAAMTLAGCNGHALKEVEYEGFSDKALDIAIAPQRDVDILFVIDNSGSMAEEQATLAANFGAFIELLELPEVAANYRIAVTTTDNGTGECSTTGPERGQFVLSSCRSRLSQFEVPNSASGPLDARAEACEDLCPAALADLETTPTHITDNPESVARPWMENIVGNINLPEGVDTATAFACLGPQGIDGCGYESPLEAMRLALTRANTETEEEFGFLRKDALLAVVFVTDEADCSFQGDTSDVFDRNGGKHLWSDLDVSYPTSGVCWNAGVLCDDGPNGLECHAADIDSNGAEVESGDGLLYPLDRYVDFLSELQDRKREQTNNPDLDILVSLVAGVSTNFKGGDVNYSDAADPAFTDEFGISPGCESGAGKAVPPVRLLSFANEFSGGSNNVFSVCDQDYTPALEQLADKLREEFKPACEQTCLRDADPIETGLQDDCVFTEVDPEGREIEVARCQRDDDGEWGLPEGVDACVYVAVDDELDDVCKSDDAAVEFRPLYRAGVPRVPGTRLETTCSVSADPANDCPWVGQ